MGVDVVYLSAVIGTNADVFPGVLDLHVPPGSVVADVTYGRGVFWRKVQPNLYDLRATDLTTGVDCRHLPYADGEIDALVLDPPYMHTPGGSAHVGHQGFERYYRNNATGNQTPHKYHDAVIYLYFEAMNEAHRVVRNRGVLIVKAQDQVCAGHYRSACSEITHFAVHHGWTQIDALQVVSTRRPGLSRGRQRTSRRNYSTFLVFRKCPPPRLATRLGDDLWPADNIPEDVK